MPAEGKMSVQNRPGQTRLANFSSPLYQILFDLAAARVWNLACPQYDSLPKTYPTIESYGDPLTHEDWQEFGDLETEIARMNYTLSRCPERGLPSACTSTIRELLTHSTVLMHWETILPELRLQTESVMQQVLQRMQKGSSYEKKSKEDFITLPVDYGIDGQSSELGLRLWRRSVAEIASDLSKGDVTHTGSFLEIHAFLKDPVCGLFKSSSKKLGMLHYLLDSTKIMLHGTAISLDAWERVIAQASQESAFLTIPFLEEVAHLHFCGLKELPYVYVPLKALHRSEFSNPKHVLEIIQEILLSIPDGGLCTIAPIVMAIYPVRDVHGGSKQSPIIIDGNHRVTAISLLNFLANKPEALPRAADARVALQEYCQEQELSQKWHLDLLDAVQTLFQPGGEPCLELIADKEISVAQFQVLTQIPALIAQEEDFHTVCTQRHTQTADKPRLLLPMHQAIYNSECWDFALPNAGQIHGRPKGFEPMPLIPFAPQRRGGGGGGGGDGGGNKPGSASGIIMENLLSTAVGVTQDV